MQMGPVDVNGGVRTARKQHQRKNVLICVRVEWRVLCELGLRQQQEIGQKGHIIGEDSSGVTQHNTTDWGV